MKTTLLAAAFVSLAASTPALRAETAYAIDSRVLLVRFDTDLPSLIQDSRAIRGLQPGESILGIDFRPANGRLYGLGSSSRLYTIDPQTALATPVGSGPFTPRLAGAEFGFDFNPTVDRIRLVSNTGQNLRLHPDTGQVAATDLALNYADGSLPSIVASAYTNSVPGATTTTLYGIDSESRALVTQAPPNDGRLNPVSILNIDLSEVAGLDISPRTGTAYLAVRVRAVNISVLYQVALDGGGIRILGFIEGFDQVSGLAIPGN